MRNEDRVKRNGCMYVKRGWGGKGTHQVMRKKNSVKSNGCVEGSASGNEE